MTWRGTIGIAKYWPRWVTADMPGKGVGWLVVITADAGEGGWLVVVKLIGFQVFSVVDGPAQGG